APPPAARLEANALVGHHGRRELALDPDLLPLDPDRRGDDGDRAAGALEVLAARRRHRELAAGEEGGLLAAARDQRRVRERADVALLLEQAPGRLERDIAVVAHVTEEAVGLLTDGERDRRRDRLGGVEAALEDAVEPRGGARNLAQE